MTFFTEIRVDAVTSSHKLVEESVSFEILKTYVETVSVVKMSGF